VQLNSMFIQCLRFLRKSPIFFCLMLSSCASFVFADVENPQLSEIGGVLGRVINIAIFGAGIVFAGYVAYGAWKASMSLGDPRGLEGAKQAWSNAIIGLVIVVGSLTIFGIILGFYGVNVTDIPNTIVTAVTSLVSVVVNGN
jgi:hypothetical protein